MIFSSPVAGTALYDYYRRIVQVLAALPPLEGTALLPVDPQTFRPLTPEDCAPLNIGVYLPEDGQITAACLNPSFAWDLIVVPTPWLEYQLRIRGVSAVLTVPSPEALAPAAFSPERVNDGRFAVASSGGFALSSGHDLVLEVMRRFLMRHEDSCFVCGWKLTRAALDSLAASPYGTPDGCSPWDLPGFLARNGIAQERVLFPPACPEEEPFRAAAMADVLLYPERSPCGDNRQAAAFRAAGRPVVMAAPLACRPLLAPDGTTVWCDPSPELLLERLEEEYQRWRLQLPGETPPEGGSGRANAAEQLHRAVSLLMPSTQPACSVSTWNRRGSVLAGLGLYAEAMENYRSALVLEPLNPETFNCIGNLMDMQERYTEALLYFDKAVALDRGFTAALFNRGTTLKRMERFADAVASYQEALGIDAGFTACWLNLAVAHALNGQEEQAESCYRRTLELDTGNTDALFLWGNQLLGQRRFEEAVDCYEKVLALEPDHSLAGNSLGITWLTLMEAEKAYAVLRKALSDNPALASAMTNIGTACRDLGRLEEAVAWYDRVLALEPDNADTRWNRALALLHRGCYREGWQEYEYRFQKTDAIGIRPSGLPLWDGSDLKGRTLLVQAEQGYGDTIQFMRYLPLITPGSGQVVMEYQDEGIRPLSGLLPVTLRSVSCLEPPPFADLRIPLMSLPRIFGTTLDTIPFPGGYLTPPVEQIALWQAILDRHALPGTLRAGFVWDGRKTFRNDKRSVPLETLAPLFDVGGITFVSLQKGEGAEQLKDFSGRYPVIDLSDMLVTFADTAALLSCLDLMIAVDTSVAHLAGAVGCPVWVMLKKGPDWRWLEERTDSPWYSSARLFRQDTDGDWDHVISNIKKNLDFYVK